MFGPAGNQPADLEVVRERFEALARQLGADSPEAVAQGALAIAIERMAEAIRRISIQRGHDLRRAVLVSFGSAGGQVACPLATCLGIERVLLHPLAGVLSAYGIGLSRQSLLRDRTLRMPAHGRPAGRPGGRVASSSAPRPASALRSAGDLGPDQGPRQLARLELRYPGSDQGLELIWPAVAPDRLLAHLRADFERRHRQRFGYVVEGEELVVERIQVEVSAPGQARHGRGCPGEWAGRCSGIGCRPDPSGSPPPGAPGDAPDPAGPAGHRHARWSGVRYPSGDGKTWRAGQALEGPALVVEPTGTTVLEPGWSGRVLAGGELLLERGPAPGEPRMDRANPVSPRWPRQLGSGASTPPRLGGAGGSGAAGALQPSLFRHRRADGRAAAQCSRSVNIRERLDFSCALFDGAGRLVANAPHIPVHLGSMGESVASLLAAVARGQLPPLRPGDAFAANDPFNGGTHLPDITVITPVFASRAASRSAAASESPLFFVACRGHHADVGGITPGSMPPFSHRIEEEGLLLDNIPLLRQGRFDAAGWRAPAGGRGPIRCATPTSCWPICRPRSAANQLGVDELERLLERHGLEEVVAYMGHVQANAAEAVRQVIDRLAGRRPCRGTRRRQPGSGWRCGSIGRPGGPGSISAAPPPSSRATSTPRWPSPRRRCSTCSAAWWASPIPLNAGCFEPLDLVVPPGCLLHPAAAGGGGGRQCGNLPGGHQRPVRCPGGDGGGPGNDEQPQLRQ